MIPESAYIVGLRGKLRRRGEVLELRDDATRLSTLRPRELRELTLVGAVSLTPDAIELLLDAGVHTVFLSCHGRYRGELSPGASRTVSLRLAQYARSNDSHFALDTAREIASAKLRNQRVMVLRHLKNHGSEARLERAAIGLAAARMRLRRTSTLDQIRGCEGSGAAVYFGGFAALIRSEELTFSKRSRQPPADPINALLSLGYTLLATTVAGAVASVGLDPHLGTLHAPLDRRPSLVCDLMEEWRAPIVDGMVVAAVNRKMLVAGDFCEASDGGVSMTGAGFRTVIRLFEERMAARSLYAPSNLKLTARQMIREQALAYARVVSGRDDGAYRPVEMR